MALRVVGVRRALSVRNRGTSPRFAAVSPSGKASARASIAAPRCSAGLAFEAAAAAAAAVSYRVAPASRSTWTFCPARAEPLPTVDASNSAEMVATRTLITCSTLDPDRDRVRDVAHRRPGTFAPSPGGAGYRAGSDLLGINARNPGIARP